jgi:hypothetical protein
MTLGEVYDWGKHVLRPRSGLNSSAVGAFQIVGSTMKTYMGRGQGSRAWEGFKSHPHERRLAEEAFRSGGTPNVAGRAQGGPVSRGHPYLVGEHGPELFMPRLSGDIFPSKGGITPGGMPPGGMQPRHGIKWRYIDSFKSNRVESSRESLRTACRGASRNTPEILTSDRVFPTCLTPCAESKRGKQFAAKRL